MLAQRPWAAELLHHWFHRLSPSDWFQPAEAVDTELRRRFADDLAMLAGCRAERFLTNPRTALAAVLLFDQLPRNLFRGSARAFAFDPLALAITHEALRRGWDGDLTGDQRVFLAMPLMHSEAILDQRASLAFFAALGKKANWQYARSHHAMIARFGRFPHRNALLGRGSTPAEQRAMEAGFAW